MTTKAELVKTAEAVALDIAGVAAGLKAINKIVSMVVVKDVLYVGTENAVYRQVEDGTFVLVAEVSDSGLKVVG